MDDLLPFLKCKTCGVGYRTNTMQGVRYYSLKAEHKKHENQRSTIVAEKVDAIIRAVCDYMPRDESFMAACKEISDAAFEKKKIYINATNSYNLRFGMGSLFPGFEDIPYNKNVLDPLNAELERFERIRRCHTEDANGKEHYRPCRKEDIIESILMEEGRITVKLIAGRSIEIALPGKLTKSETKFPAVLLCPKELRMVFGKDDDDDFEYVPRFPTDHTEPVSFVLEIDK